MMIQYIIYTINKNNISNDDDELTRTFYDNNKNINLLP